MAKKAQALWNGHPLLDEKHAQDLELRSAVNEFHHGHPREQAEKLALEDYRREHHARAAAHHMNGMKAAQATGAQDDAAQHFALYRLHVKALGHEPHDAVPPEVKRYMAGNEGEHTYRFKGHGADTFLVNTGIRSTPAPQPIQKSERRPLSKAEQRLFDYLLDLGKGEVVHIHGSRSEPPPCPKCGDHDTESTTLRGKGKDRVCVGCNHAFDSRKVPLPEGPKAPRAPDGSRDHLRTVK